MKIHASALPNIPWQPRPAGNGDLVWRYDANPVIGRRPLPRVTGIYNSAVVPWRGGFAGVFRTEGMDRLPRLHTGRSADGLKFEFNPRPVAFRHENGAGEIGRMEYAYDPRVTEIEGVHYITWCNGYHGPTIGIARTTDFESFEQLENAFLPYNRNGVLFPRKIGGKFFMLSRPSDTGHTPFGDIFLSESPDLVHWGRHRHVIGKGGPWWQGVKIGAGPSPIETDEGWLLFYHGVTGTCNGFIYAIGAMLLDLENPSRVIACAREALLCPEAPYELAGFVPGVCFPVGCLCDADTGRIAIYYGAADTVTALCFCNAHEIIPFIKANSIK
ncbi:MAG: glycoside hydrolase family 130 protein [Opitutaceae bacterium]|jgi:beta-1,4-mannooligosaccharide/beta-1,4-mannosyl-N-acetylglucosamine phosphorylase|nr:glycoside hydrolase family 130 protein [Opitutaceae bacterium]